MNIVSAVILCTIVGAIGAVVLVLAAKFMAVEEDPRIEEVSACLAGANCGGCGYAGCADYAKAVVMDGVPCDKCAPILHKLPHTFHQLKEYAPTDQSGNHLMSHNLLFQT